MQPYHHDDFGHLEGASGYSVDFDDASSLHSSLAPSTAPDDRTIPPDDAEAIQRIGDLNFDDLSISGLDDALARQPHPHADPDPDHDHDLALAGNGNVANLYEDDFEGMLDDLNRELPPHACRCVSTSPPSSSRTVEPHQRLPPSPTQLLRHPQPGLRRQVPRLQQVVLQLARLDLGLAHRQPPRARKAQGGDAPRREPARRDDARVLLVRRQERLHPRLHPGKERHGRRPPVPVRPRLTLALVLAQS